MATDYVLSIRNLKKSFQSHWTFRQIPAVKDVSLDVERGELFGFLGHNGAGKTTTIKCITGLVRPTSGTILLNGEQIRGSRQHQGLGYLPEQPYFYDHLTVQETMEFFAALYGLTGANAKDRIRRTLERVGLSERTKNRVRALSKGLQQRLGFAQAILHGPSLLILDEPFSGLDPIGRKEMRELIVDLNRKGTTIFMSSHVLGDVEQICHRVSIMAKGELKAVFDLREKSKLFGEVFELQVKGSNSTHPALGALTAEFYETELASGVITRYRFVEQAAAFKALDAARNLGAEVLLFERQSKNLEEIFIQVTQQGTEVLGDNR